MLQGPYFSFHLSDTSATSIASQDNPFVAGGSIHYKIPSSVEIKPDSSWFFSLLFKSFSSNQNVEQAGNNSAWQKWAKTALQRDYAQLRSIEGQPLTINNIFKKRDYANAIKCKKRCTPSLAIRGMQTKTRMNYLCTKIRMAKILKSNKSKHEQGCEATGTLVCCRLECQVTQARWKTLWQFLLKLT